ncbi:MAG: hypothetical protein AAF496_00950 [Pseudomonadota bacterium]
MSNMVRKPTDARARPVALTQRIDELRTRPPVDLNRGEALLLQGMAVASFREQRLAGEADASQE